MQLRLDLYYRRKTIKNSNIWRLKTRCCLWRNVYLVLWPIFWWVIYFSGLEHMFVFLIVFSCSWHLILLHCDQKRCLKCFQFFLNLPRLDLWPRMWYILKNVPLISLCVTLVSLSTGSLPHPAPLKIYYLFLLHKRKAYFSPILSLSKVHRPRV